MLITTNNLSLAVLDISPEEQNHFLLLLLCLLLPLLLGLLAVVDIVAEPEPHFLPLLSLLLRLFPALLLCCLLFLFLLKLVLCFAAVLQHALFGFAPSVGTLLRFHVQ